RDDRRVREPLAVAVLAAVADAEVVDRDEDPTTRRVPARLRTGRRAGQILGVVAPAVAAAGFREAHDRRIADHVGQRHRDGDAGWLAEAGRVGDVEVEIDCVHYFGTAAAGQYSSFNQRLMSL